MPLPQKQAYTSQDYWNLPEGQRAELIHGRFYAMAPPSRLHQELVSQFTKLIGNYIDSHKGKCKVYPAPFAVDLNADDKNWVEPDISVICDPNKLTDKGCLGAPELIIEIISPSSRKMDYITKNALYSDAGVKEYWIVDPQKEIIVIYRFDEDAAPALYPFDIPVYFGIFPDLTVTLSKLLM